MNFLGCYKVKDSDLIKESYKLEDKRILVNISKEKYDDLLYAFLDNLEEPCFFILEVPLTLQEERKLQQNDFNRPHNQVYYIDGLSKEKLKNMFDKYLTTLKNNGLISFGFASHFAHNEIMFTKYNLAYIYSEDVQKYSNMLSELGVSESKNFITAWDTFSEKSPGDAFNLNTSENSLEKFIDYATICLGMYKAEIR